MSNPYTSVSVNNYNANPPPDDGSGAAANLLTWQFHLDKIGGPLKTALESVNTNITAAFAKVPFIDTVALTSAHTQVTGDRGKLYTVASGTFTIDLLASATAGDGFSFGVQNNGSGVVTLDPNGAETINGSATLAVQTGEGGLFVTDGTNWYGFLFSLSELGITATVAELNELDASAAAVSNYGNTGVRHYLHDDIANATALDVDANIGTSYESVGPTSSAATNIWTPLDDVPLSATAVIISIRGTVSGATSGQFYSADLDARKTGSSQVAGQHSKIWEVGFSNQSGASETAAGVSEAIIPVDSANRFDLSYLASGTGVTSAVGIYLRGFIA